MKREGLLVFIAGCRKDCGYKDVSVDGRNRLLTVWLWDHASTSIIKCSILEKSSISDGHHSDDSSPDLDGVRNTE